MARAGRFLDRFDDEHALDDATGSDAPEDDDDAEDDWDADGDGEDPEDDELELETLVREEQ